MRRVWHRVQKRQAASNKKQAIRARTYSCELEAERRTEDNAEKREPAHRETNGVRELEERCLDAWDPDSLDRAGHDRVRDEPEGNRTL